MLQEHERAKHAYEKVKTYVTTAVPLNDVHPPAALQDTGLDIYVEDGQLCFVGDPAGCKARLKALDNQNPAWKGIVDRLSESSKDKKLSDYKTWATRLPSMIRACGLLQTLAFYETKQKQKKKPIEAALSCLTDWLTAQWPLRGHLGGPNSKDVASLEPAIYRAATREALAYADWVKRYVSSMLPDD